MNPRAAINDLHPFQGCPFSHLGYFSMHRMYALRIILMSIKVDADICRIFTAVYSIILSWRRYLQRRGWDSNPRALADKRFSRPPRYDHFDTPPCRCIAIYRQFTLMKCRFLLGHTYESKKLFQKCIPQRRKNYSSKKYVRCQPLFSFFSTFFSKL